MGFMNLQAYLNLPVTKPICIINNGLLDSDAFTLISGAEGIGKSLLALQMAWSIASGTAFLGETIERPGRVMLVQHELKHPDIQLRCRRQLAGKTPPVELYVDPDAHNYTLPATGERTDLDTAIATLRPSVIILDPLTELLTFDENDATSVKRGLLEPFARWKAAGTSVVLVHHHSKPSNEYPRKGTARVRGSSAIAASADTNIQLIQEDITRPIFTLEFAKLRRWSVRLPLPLRRDPDTLTFAVQDVAAHILARVTENHTMTPGDVADTLRSVASASTVHRYIAQLVEAGRLVYRKALSGKPGRPPMVLALPDR